MVRYMWLISILFLVLGCSGQHQTDWPDGSWEGVAMLDGVGFFLGLDSENGNVSISVPQMLINKTVVHKRFDRNGQLSVSVPLGFSTLQLLLKEQEGILVGKVVNDSRVGSVSLYPGSYKKIHRMNNQPSREGEAIALKTPFGVVRGTLLLPPIESPFTTVLLVAGSGPTDRDGNSELIVENNDMLYHLAQHLLDANIASLRFDKMGVGESLFNEQTMMQEYTFDNSVEVVLLLLKMLEEDSRIGKVGIIGHSEGSLVALLAAQEANVDFAISLAGNADPISQQLINQVRAIDYDCAVLLERRLDQITRSHFEMTGNPIVDALIQEGSEAYLASWMQYDPQAILQTLMVPALVVKGDMDERLHTSDDWFEASTLPAHVEIKEIRNMGHLLKEVYSQNDISRSYRDGTMPLHPDLVETINTFISRF